MATASDEGGTTLEPDEAFAVLGNETRMEILQALSGSNDPMAFSELRDQVGVSDSGQFNYHLDKLKGHFLEGTDDGYTLRRAGERVVESVLSGAVTEAPRIEPTTIDRDCPLCGAPVRVSYQQEWAAMSCTECEGIYGVSGASGDDVAESMEQGYLGGQPLPPAGIEARTPAEVLEAADTWSSVETLAASTGMCPRCSAKLDRSLRICENHDASDGLCEECDRQHAVQIDRSCTNCPYHGEGAAVIAIAANTDLLAFQTTHGLNPVLPTTKFYDTMWDYDEELVSLDPFEARFTWTADGDSITLSIDEKPSVINVERSQAG